MSMLSACLHIRFISMALATLTDKIFQQGGRIVQARRARYVHPEKERFALFCTRQSSSDRLFIFPTLSYI